MTTIKNNGSILVEDLYAIESAKTGALYDYAMKMLEKEMFTTPLRRKMGMAAKKYLFDRYKKEIESMTPRVSILVRIALAGMAKAEDALAILYGYPEYIDAENLYQACVHAGAGYAFLFGVADRWWGMSNAQKGISFSAKYQRRVIRPQAIKAYRNSPCFDTARGVVVSLLPLPECIHCFRTGTVPNIGQASRALNRAPGGCSSKACEEYILGIIPN